MDVVQLNDEALFNYGVSPPSWCGGTNWMLTLLFNLPKIFLLLSFVYLAVAYGNKWNRNSKLILVALIFLLILIIFELNILIFGSWPMSRDLIWKNISKYVCT